MSLYRRVYEINEMSSLENIVDSSSHIKFKRGDVFVGDEEVLQIDRDASIRRIFEEFIGNKLIISGLIGEKKLSEKEKEEIETEEVELKNLQNTLNRVEKKLDQFESEVNK